MTPGPMSPAATHLAFMRQVAATLTRDRHAHPLVTLNGGPFNGVDIYPAELRRMAQQLLAVADIATKLPTGGKHWRPTTVVVGNEPTPLKEMSNG